MKSPMDYVEESYLTATGWGSHASYADIIQTSRNILDFDVPSSASLCITNQTSPLLINSQRLTHTGVVGGSMTYAYTSIPIALPPSKSSPLEQLVQRYRHPLYNALATLSGKPESVKVQPNSRNTLLYGQLCFPSRALEAMALAQLSSGRSHLALKWICDDHMPQPVVLTATYRALRSEWSREFIYSTHENLLGFRALGTIADWVEGPVRTQFAIGCEVFYAASRKSPGASIGARYVTSSKHTLTPLTVTLVANPLMGSIGIAYALKPSPYVALATRYDFNFYSYVSDLSVGCELWRTEPVSASARRQTDPPDQKNPIPAPGAPPDKPMSVFKASTALATQSARLMWETTYRGLLVSLGTIVHYGNPNIPIHWGVDLNYVFSDIEPTSQESDSKIDVATQKPAQAPLVFTNEADPLRAKKISANAEFPQQPEEEPMLISAAPAASPVVVLETVSPESAADHSKISETTVPIENISPSKAGTTPADALDIKQSRPTT